MSASYDGYSYYCNDPAFINSISNGNTEPYPIDLSIVKKYFHMFPHKNGTYIDIGAHIGTTIMPYSKMFNRIIGYDPCCDNFELLKKNVEINKINHCEIYNYGIYKHSCRGTVYLHGCNSGCYYFKEEENGMMTCKTLDEEMEDLQLENVDFIKMDTEGCELFVMQGGAKLLKKWKPFIQFESNHLSEKLYGISENDVVCYLKNLGYLPFDVEKKGANLFFYHPNESLNIVPRNLFCFWTGENEMSKERKECLKQMKVASNVNVKFLHSNEIVSYMIPSFPFHPAYQYLSETHKADYLRMYFMHFYGGGYSDIKKQKCDWNSSFDKMMQSDLYGIGYPEVDEWGVANKNVMKHWNVLIGNGCYIIRPNTPFTQKWYHQVHELLDQKLEYLKQHPASFPQDCKEKGLGYPIEWNEMLGRIFHLLNYEYHSFFRRDLVCPILNNYR